MSDYDRQFHEAHGASGRPAGFGRVLLVMIAAKLAVVSLHRSGERI